MSTPIEYAVCVDNDGYPASLELHKIYEVLPDPDAAKDGDLRIVDESGEDYLFPAGCFAPIHVPERIGASLLRTASPARKSAVGSEVSDAGGIYRERSRQHGSTVKFKWNPSEPPPVIESHSKAKLDVLRSYLRAYFNRLNARPQREEFKLDLVDGFAGGGIFLDCGNPISGTPLIMLEELKAAEVRLNVGRRKPLHFDCKCYFVDVNRAHTDHLRKAISERGFGVDDEKTVVRNGAFEDEVDNIVADIARRQPRAGRAIFLLDQTGFANVELSLVSRILDRLPAAEVILTFAADMLVNTLRQEQKYITAVAPLQLTESKVDEMLAYKGGAGGRALIQRVLRNQIRDTTKATFDTPFFIRPGQSRRALWFLHLSRHPTARDVMVQCHWDIHNTFEHYGRGDFGMLGWDSLIDLDSMPLFCFDELDGNNMHDGLLDSMPSQLYSLASEEPVSVGVIRHSLANDTAARFTDLDEAIIRLAKEQDIDILTSDGKTRGRNLKRLHHTDMIARPAQPIFSVLSRSR